MSQYVAEAKQIIRSHKYVMLTANWCPDCVYANSIWRKFGVLNKVSQFEVGGYDRVKLNKYRDAFAEVAGIRNLPTIFVDGKVWGTEAELHKYEREGTLLEELKKIGLID